MTSLGEPTRWLDAIAADAEGDDAFLADVLRAGRSELPSEERLAAIWAGLGPLPPGGGTPEGGTPEGGTPDGGAPNLDPGFVDPGLGMTAAGAASGLKVAVAKFALVAAVGAVAVGVPTYYVTRPPAVSGVAPAPVVSTATVAAGPPLAPTSFEIAEPAPAPEPEAASDVQTAPALPRRSEIELLQDAQAALGSQPARALALVGEAAALYPNGALGQEREMIRIQALVGTGRRAEALASARAFRDRYPQSPHVRRLEALFPELGQP